MEMSWDGDVVYSGPKVDAVEAVRRIRQWSHLTLDFAAAQAIWNYREELVLD